MSKYKKNFIAIILSLTLVGVLIYLGQKNKLNSSLPIVAIANWGPHSSLEESLKGIKAELNRQGFIEGKTVQLQIADVSFDTALIPQMVTQLKNLHPDVIIAVGTPISQFVKNTIKDIPLVFSVITDPVAAGLLQEEDKPSANMTGTSDKQDLESLLAFAKKLLPNATRIGILYATSEANDIALVKMLNDAAAKSKMTVLALPINQARDVPMQMHFFKDQVDFIYVGASGPIQPTLPAIIAEADKMNIPIFNVNEDAVEKHQVLASFGVDYNKIGMNTGKLISQILRGKTISDLPPIYPNPEDHQGFISSKKAKALNIKTPSNLTNTTIIQ